jgi:hypothetical protein
VLFAIEFPRKRFSGPPGCNECHSVDWMDHTHCGRPISVVQSCRSKSLSLYDRAKRLTRVLSDDFSKKKKIMTSSLIDGTPYPICSENARKKREWKTSFTHDREIRDLFEYALAEQGRPASRSGALFFVSLAWPATRKRRSTQQLEHVRASNGA